MHYELAVVSVGSQGQRERSKFMAHRLTPQGYSLFWTGDRVNDTDNAKRVAQGLDRALGSLQELGWECIARNIQSGAGMILHTAIRKPIENGPTYEYCLTGNRITEVENSLSKEQK